MATMKVVVTDYIREPLAIEQEILGDIAEVVAVDAKNNQELEQRVQEADALLVFHFVSIEQPLMERLSNLKVVGRCGAGYDNVDTDFARSRDIAVTNVPDYGTEDVADAAIALTLSLARGTHLMAHICQRGTDNWSYELAIPLRRIRGQQFGIIGAGRIGMAVALRAKALGYRVAFFDPYAGDGLDKSLGIHRADSLEELLEQSQVISCHCPLSDETRYLMNDQTIACMPRGSILINTARGGVVDPLAVLKALESGHLMGAGIDVLEQEPPDPEHPLMQAWRDPQHPAHTRLILTPHAAFYSEEGLADMRRKGATNVRQVLLGEPCRNIVNRG